MDSTSRTIRTNDGREIRFTDAGPSDGLPVLVQHGTPGSRLLFDPWIADAGEQGLRLIGYDRPGYGGSTPQPDRAVADAAADVRAIAEALGIRRLCTWGASGGGPHTLACAALLPDLVAAAAVLGSVAPPGVAGLDWLAGMGEDNIAEFNAALAGRTEVQAFVEALAAEMVGADPQALAEALRSLLSPVDRGVLTDAFAAFMLRATRVAIGERRDGWIDDDLAFTRPWGVALDQIRVPVLLLHGAHDRFVPFAHGRWLAEHIPGVNARLSADDGHLTLVVNRVPEVHAWLRSQMT